MPEIERGDIVLVSLTPSPGAEPAPTTSLGVVVQNDAGNRHGSTTVIAACTTDTDGATLYPFEVDLPADTHGVPDDAVVDLSQLYTVDTETRILQLVGRVPDEQLPAVDRALAVSLGLD